MKIQAVADFVLIEPIIQEKVGIIYLPDQSKKEVSNALGTVISVGPEDKYGLKAGDTVVYRKHEGTVIMEKYLVLAPKWILAVVS